MKTFFRKKTKKKMKRAFFLFMSILFFCQSVYPSFGIARTSSPSISDEIYYSEDSKVDLASEMELATGVEIKPEANKEEKQEYDPQPETEEDVQGWIDRYLESENDESEKPNWEKEVDEELRPDGWKVELVEGGDESFDRDYYTIFLDYDEQPEKIEEVREWIEIYVESDLDENEKPNWEEEVEENIVPNGWEIEFIEDGDENFDGDYYTFSIDYDAQPETIEEVQKWTGQYVESDDDEKELPNWEKDVDEGILPAGWAMTFVEGGDENFEADYYTLLVEYDAQPETIEEVQKWMKEYVESDNDKSKLPNWEKDVDKGILPAGWIVTFVEGGDENFESDYYTLLVDYDAQPETIEEVQEWINKYIESENDPSERPNWEKDVDEALIPEGWGVKFIEGGDESFEADYYTISEVEKSEEADPEAEQEGKSEEADPEAEQEEESEEETFEYDPQPTTKEEVQEWVDKYIDSNYNPSAKPHWESEVEKDLMPKNWKTDFVEGGDVFFGLDYYTIFPDVMVMSILPSDATSGDLQAAITAAADVDTIEISSDMTFTSAVTIPSGKNITIKSVDGPWTLKQPESVRHFIVEGSLTLENIVLDGVNKDNLGGGVEVQNRGNLIMNDGAIIQNCYAVLGGAVLLLGDGRIDEADVTKHTVNSSAATSSFVMQGGKIVNNKADGGGGVLVRNNSLFVMKDDGDSDTPEPVIRENKATADTASGYGGGVGVELSTFQMSAGEISKNTTTFAGGGVTLGYGSNFTLTGGSISENKATGITGNDKGGFGGGIVIGDRNIDNSKQKRSTFEMEGGSIYKNDAKYEGGGVVISISDFTMTGGNINENTTGDAAGGVWVGAYLGSLDSGSASTFTMTNGTISDNTSDNAGGGVVVENESTFEMGSATDGNSDPKITNNRAGTEETDESDNPFAGGVGVSDATFTMYSGEISGNYATYAGGGVALGFGANFTLEGGKVSKNTTESYGGGVVIGDRNYREPTGAGMGSNFTMNGGEISNNRTNLQGGGVVISSSDFEMTGGEIKENNTKNAGGGVWVGTFFNKSKPSTFTMSGGSINKNTTQEKDFNGNGEIDEDEKVEIVTAPQSDPRAHDYFSVGGGVMVDDGSEFTMTEGGSGEAKTSPVISGNSSYHHGGGVMIQDKSNFNMEAGKISGNTSHYSGGGVYVGYQNFVINDNPAEMDGSTFNMTGGTIEGNTTEYLAKVAKRFLYGGGVHVDKAYFNMGGSGDPKIFDNTAGYSGGGVSIASGDFKMKGGSISGNVTDPAKNPSTADPSTYGGGVWVGRSYTRGDNGNDAQLTPKSTFTMSGGIIGGDNGIFDKDRVGGNSGYGNYASESGGGVYISRGVTFNMYGTAKIKYNHTNNRGGGVYASWGSDWSASYGAKESPSTFNLNGDEDGKFSGNGTPEISYNEAKNAGGGVYIAEQTKFYMWDGATINKNSSNERGGGVAVLQSSFYMHGGVISNNESVERGGGIVVVRGIVKMYDGEITGNKTANTAGGIYIGKQVPEGYVIDENKTPQELKDKKVTSYLLMENGKISGNSAGANVDVEAEVDTDVGASARDAGIGITAVNTSGGGVTIDGGSLFEMSGGNITSNITTQAGGGVAVRRSSTFNMSGGNILNNESNLTGGGVYVIDTEQGTDDDNDEVKPSIFNMSDGTIRGNKASYGTPLSQEEAAEAGVENLANGGGVAIIRSVFNMNGDEKGIFTGTNGPFPNGAKEPKIIGNEATNIGGGVFANDGSIVYMHDGAEISQNETKTWDGGVLIHWNSKFYMHGGKVNNNTSVFNGGGVGIISSDFVMTDGEISGNTTTSPTDSTGGGVMVGRSDIRGVEVKNEDGTTTTKMFTIPGTFEMSGGTIKENHAANSGGGVSIEDGSEFTMKKNSTGGEDPSITGNRTELYAGGVAVQQSTFTMNAGDITGNVSYQNGGGVGLESSVFKMTGGTISENKTAWEKLDGNNFLIDGAGAGGVWVSKWAAYDEMSGKNDPKLVPPSEVTAENGISYFYMSGANSKISANEAKASGGGVSVEDGSLFEMSAGTIESNLTNDAGAGVSVQQASTFNMSGGFIKENKSQFTGAGVFVIDTNRYGDDTPTHGATPPTTKPSIFNMSGGTIDGNSTTSTLDLNQQEASQLGVGNLANGGGVALVRSVFNFNGNATDKFSNTNGPFANGAGKPTISNNTAKHIGGGVFADDYSEVYMYDGAVIDGNNTDTWDGGMLIHWKSTFEMHGGDIINNTSYFNGGGVGIVSSKFDMYDGYIAGNSTTSPTDSTGGGVMIGGSDIVTGGLDPKNMSKGEMHGGQITDNTAVNSGGGVSVEDGSEFKLSGGVIGVSESDEPEPDGRFANGNRTKQFGGGVNVQGGSTFVMEDGNIRGNYSGSIVERTGGGGVFVGLGSGPNGVAGRFEMSGGVISNNATCRAGGGVYIHIGGDFLLKDDGKIIDNLADSNIDKVANGSLGYSTDGGGGVFVNTGKIVMENGQVSGNRTESVDVNGASGGGIALLDNSEFTMDNGIISDNFAEHGGGGVLLNTNNTFTMYNGEIIRNEADGGDPTWMSGGGGVYMFRTNIFYMYDGKINENTAGKNGGGIGVYYHDEGTRNDSIIYMYGGEINSNRVTGRNQHAEQGYGGGGGIYLYEGATLNMEKQPDKKAPEIKNNTAGIDNAGEQSPFGTNGGGIYVKQGYLNITSGIVAGNTAVGNGGGIFLAKDNDGHTNTVKILGTDTDPTSIINNTAGGYGGGIFVENAHTAGYVTTGRTDFYNQLTTDNKTKFSGNVATILSYPPDWVRADDNADYNYPKMEYASISVPGRFNHSNSYYNYTFNETASGNEMYHPLNNYDINFRRDPVVSQFSFFKGDAADSTNTVRLAGAQFKLVDIDPDSPTKGKYYNRNEITGVVTWTTEENQATIVESQENGQVTFNEVTAGTFKLIEVKAPAGYQLPTGYWEITVVGGQITATKAGDGAVPPAFKNVGTETNPIYQVGNIQNPKLPLTGNGGFYWLVALGLLLVAAGTTRVIYNRRKKSQDSSS